LWIGIRQKRTIEEHGDTLLSPAMMKAAIVQNRPCIIPNEQMTQLLRVLYRMGVEEKKP
jgi:hypothetical protein